MSHPSFEGFRREFARVFGARVVDALVEDFATRAVVLLGGDQATGKTTAARKLGRALDGPAGSAGSIVRAEAVSLGVTFEEAHRRLFGDAELDVRHDHLAAEAIGAGRVVVFEGRLAGHLGAWLRSLGRVGLVSVYLKCPSRERALRWLTRASSIELRRDVEARLVVPEAADFETSIAALEALADPRIEQLAHEMSAAATRDRQDRARLQALYGFDYGDTSIFDIVLDTSNSDSEETSRRILELVSARR